MDNEDPERYDRLRQAIIRGSHVPCTLILRPWAENGGRRCLQSHVEDPLVGDFLRPVASSSRFPKNVINRNIIETDVIDQAS